MFGSGGVTIELTKDVAFASLPLNETTARNLISKTKVSSLIKGYRGQMPYDEQSLIKALIGLSQLASDCGDKLVSIDINPFTVQQSGGIALDALIILKK
jgi:acetyltransferase